MSICDTCRHQAPHRNCRLAIERGAGIFWGDRLRKCEYREAKVGDQREQVGERMGQKGRAEA